jgi:putative NADH-flavin reductase
MMKHIAVVGATGATGKEVIRLVLQKCYRVTAIARKPDAITPAENLRVAAGDVTDVGSLLETFKAADTVISCFGPANGLKAGNLMSTGARNMVQAAEKAGVKRLVFMSGILQTDGKELGFLNQLGIRFIRLFYYEIYKDKVVAEAFVQQSSLQWIIVRAAGLQAATVRGAYTAGPRARIAPFKPLAYADCAACLLRAAEESAWTHKIINVGR